MSTQPLLNAKEAFSEVCLEESRTKVMMDKVCLEANFSRDILKGPIQIIVRARDTLGVTTAINLETSTRHAGKYIESCQIGNQKNHGITG